MDELNPNEAAAESQEERDAEAMLTYEADLTEVTDLSEIEHYIDGEGNRKVMPESMKKAIADTNHSYAQSIKRNEDNY